MIYTGFEITGFLDCRDTQKWWRKPKSWSRISNRKPKNCQVDWTPLYLDFLTGNWDSAGEIQIPRQVFQTETQILIVISSPDTYLSCLWKNFLKLCQWKEMKKWKEGKLITYHVFPESVHVQLVLYVTMSTWHRSVSQKNLQAVYLWNGWSQILIDLRLVISLSQLKMV